MAEENEMTTHIFAVRTAANREDQVIDYLISKLERGDNPTAYCVIRAHGMRGYIFIEAASKLDAEAAVARVPYARGILPQEIPYQEIEHMLEQIKVEMNIRKNDIVEIITGPFKRENAKVIRINKVKEEVVVEPIPITVSMDSVKVIRREEERAEEEEDPELKL
jgi:transcription elongation factor Spt5